MSADKKRFFVIFFLNIRMSSTYIHFCSRLSGNKLQHTHCILSQEFSLIASSFQLGQLQLTMDIKKLKLPLTILLVSSETSELSLEQTRRATSRYIFTVFVDRQVPRSKQTQTLISHLYLNAFYFAPIKVQKFCIMRYFFSKFLMRQNSCFVICE